MTDILALFEKLASSSLKSCAAHVLIYAPLLGFETPSSFPNKASSIRYIFLILFSSLVLSHAPAYASNKSLPIPRFASIKSNEVNARAGPSIKSPIEWVFIKKGEPVEIIAEYDQWRQIRDIKGEGGWVHSSVLSGKRYAIITSKEIITLLKKPDASSKVVAKVSPDVRCQVSKCKEDWCRIKCQNHEGWILKNYLFGVYESENF